MISENILRCRYIFTIYSELGMKLNDLNILQKKKILKNSKLPINIDDIIRYNLFWDKSIFEYLIDLGRQISFDLILRTVVVQVCVLSWFYILDLIGLSNVPDKDILPINSAVQKIMMQ